jgi:hypothetical protein
MKGKAKKIQIAEEPALLAKLLASSLPVPEEDIPAELADKAAVDLILQDLPHTLEAMPDPAGLPGPKLPQAD